MNYLRPDIKRGNFAREEEETIIRLHQELGNKWSVMAARLPGRTDNEIKNVWHTHLKKRVARNPLPEPEPHNISMSELDPKSDRDSAPNSPSHSSSDTSSVTTTYTAEESGQEYTADKNFLEMDESFWSEVDFSVNDSSNDLEENLFDGDLSMQGGTDFWLELFYNAEEIITGLPAFL